MTKKERGMYNHYIVANPNHTELWHVYGSWSQLKENTMQYCKNHQAQNDGFSGKIVSSNGRVFTYAYKYHNKEDNKLHLVYITKSHDYDFIIPSYMGEEI